MDNSEDLQQFLTEQAHVLAEASVTLVKFIENIAGFFDDLSNFVENKSEEDKKNFKEFERHTGKLRQYLDQVHTEIPELTKVIKKAENEIRQVTHENEQLRGEANDLKNQLRFQIDECHEANVRFAEARTIMDNQSTFSARMGAVLGTMLWKTSKTEEVIQTFIETETLNNFMNLAVTTLSSFRETYILGLPNSLTSEFKFMVAIYGIFINVVAQKNGRNFVLEREIGVEFVRGSVEYLGEIPMPDGQLLKRLILMMLYNFSITKQGAMMIEYMDGSVENILRCQSANHTTEIQALSLNLITTLLNELPTREFCQKVAGLVSQHDLELIYQSDDERLVIQAQQFVARMHEFHDDL